MTDSQASDIEAVLILLGDVCAQVLGDPQTWIDAATATAPRPLAWPWLEQGTGWQQLLAKAFNIYVDQALLAIQMSRGERWVPVANPQDKDFQFVLRAAHTAHQKFKHELVEWARRVGKIGRLSGIRDLRNRLKAEAVAAAITASRNRGERVPAVAIAGGSKSSAYRAMHRKQKP